MGRTCGGAIDAYESALTVYSKDAHPTEWAATQSNLANAWRNLPTGDRGENLRKAIAACEAALTIRTRADHPVEWAGTQNNLGNAWMAVRGDRAGDVGKAMAALRGSAHCLYPRRSP